MNDSSGFEKEASTEAAVLPVLAIIDVQDGFLNTSTEHLPDLIYNYVTKASDRYSKIVATQFYNPEGSNFEKLLRWERLRGEHETRLDRKIASVSDTIVTKSIYSAAPELLTEARATGTREIHLCGIDTDVCVLLSASGIFDAGYYPKVLHFLCASSAGKEAHEAAAKQLGRIIGRNQVLTDPGTQVSL